MFEFVFVDNKLVAYAPGSVQEFADGKWGVSKIPTGDLIGLPSADLDEVLKLTGGLEPIYDEDVVAEEDEKASKSPEFLRELYEWTGSIVGVLAVLVLVFLFAVRIIGIDGRSMENTLFDGEWVVVSNICYEPQRGDVVIFAKNDFLDGKPLVKRVIGVAGDTINIDFDLGVVYVNGEAVDDSNYVKEPTTSWADMSFPLTVGEGHLFVMGDNRNHSTDSRDSRVGLVDERELLGKVYFRLLPITKFGALNH